MTARQRTLTLVPEPVSCRVCGDKLRVRLVQVGRARSSQAVIPCPHCCPASGEMAVPIYVYDLRDDFPRGAAS